MGKLFKPFYLSYGKTVVVAWSLFFFCLHTQAQITFPVNGITDPRTDCYAFTNATIIKDDQNSITNGTMVIREGKITAVGSNINIPPDAVVINCKGKYIYPSLIDIYTDYGIPQPQRQQPSSTGFFAAQQFNSITRGAYDWNQAIRPEVNASEIFAVDDKDAKSYRDLGFGSVLTHQKDGIARGTGAFVTLANKKENLVIVKERASAHYSFSKGTSTQTYPSSMMGSVALLRQTYLDGQWYKSKPVNEGINQSLQAWNNEQDLPQIFDANDKWSDLRADHVGDEFGIQYIIKGGGNEYQRVNDIAATKAPMIISLNFPPAQEVDDPIDARYVSLTDLKHWELAPTNPGTLEKAHIAFALTTADLQDKKQFWPNLRKAIDYGLSEKYALQALTKLPATWLGVYDKVGSLDAGKLANFLITTGPLFNEKTDIVENWIQGEKYEVKEDAWLIVNGSFNLVMQTSTGTQNFQLNVRSDSSAEIIAQDTNTAQVKFKGKLVSISFSPVPEKKSEQGNFRRGRVMPTFRLSGVSTGDTWEGNGIDTSGNPFTWTATLIKSNESSDSSRHKPLLQLGKVNYPFGAYGWDSLPHQEDLLIKNATVWTNEAEGILTNTDVLVRNGKIIQVGKSLTAGNARIIDGTNQYLTPGIIDEHSHIAAFSINEGAHSVTSEVRIGDNLNPEDIEIYRQLAGGVTTSHILHGSANTIGGQTQLIKLRWGANDEELKFKGADPFIKFALGENVKRTGSSQVNTRYPDTRMGVEQIQVDAFTRAVDYEKQMKDAASVNGKKTGNHPSPVRRDLQLDALVEILNGKRFITCHSYVQSEIMELMRVAEEFGFRVNTFTHILEGYKVADKIKAHGANASTFSDWWAYKMEVQDAIAYNAAIMVKEGLNVCINSDDPEEAHHLNQEAAKSMKYGGLTEDQAFRMVTLNPAKALHIDDRVGSIKVGKDADLVLWSDDPLSVYARVNKTIVDGIVYFDRERDRQLRQQITAERNRLIQKMISEGKSNPSRTIRSRPSVQVVLHCEEGDHDDGILTADSYDETQTY